MNTITLTEKEFIRAIDIVSSKIIHHICLPEVKIVESAFNYLIELLFINVAQTEENDDCYVEKYAFDPRSFCLRRACSSKTKEKITLTKDEFTMSTNTVFLNIMHDMDLCADKEFMSVVEFDLLLIFSSLREILFDIE